MSAFITALIAIGMVLVGDYLLRNFLLSGNAGGPAAEQGDSAIAGAPQQPSSGKSARRVAGLVCHRYFLRWGCGSLDSGCSPQIDSLAADLFHCDNPVTLFFRE
jgi:hypothetical protein